MTFAHLDDALAQLTASASPYLEFMRTESFSVGLYVLGVGAVDHQSPHAEDEVYYVVRGTARVTVGDETRGIAPGALVRAAPGVVHRFHDIAEELHLLVFFAPPEGSSGDERE